jgi:integrase
MRMYHPVTEQVADQNDAAAGDRAGQARRPQLGAACPRLRRPDGSWSHRHGAWYYVLELSDIPGDRRRQIKRGGHTSQQQATDALAHVRALVALSADADAPGRARAQITDLIAASHRDHTRLPTLVEVRRKILLGRAVTEQLTLGQWLSEWLAGKGDIRASTRRSYASHIRLYLTPHLGHVSLDRLRVQHIQAMFTAILEANTGIEAAHDVRAQARADLLRARNDRDPVAIRTARARLLTLPPITARVVGPATRQRIRATLRAALSDAAAQGLLTSNPAKLVKLPSGRRPKALVWTDERVARWQATGLRPSPVMVWTPAQTVAFLAHARGHQLYALFHLVTHLGLRRGEAVGLRWSDLHLDDTPGPQGVRATLTVAQQVVQLGWTTETGAPKSDAGERVLPVAPATVAVLKAHRRLQAALRLAAGQSWVDTGLVFTLNDGTGWHPADVSDSFTAAAAAAGLPPIRLHDLRHGTATHALAAGIDIKVVQEMLGHSSSTITRDTYTSVLDDAKHAAAAAIADTLAQPAGDRARRGRQRPRSR